MFDRKVYVAGSLAVATFIYILWGPSKRKSKKRGRTCESLKTTFNKFKLFQKKIVFFTAQGSNKM